MKVIVTISTLENGAIRHDSHVWNIPDDAVIVGDSLVINGSLYSRRDLRFPYVGVDDEEYTDDEDEV